MKKSMTKIFLMGIWSGILTCLIVLLLLQSFGIIPKWWGSRLSDDVRERAAVIEQYIDRYYWKDDVSEKKFAEMAAKGLVAALGDKYSVYYTDEEYKETMNAVNGGYAGIGATIRMEDNTNKKIIEELQEGKPAEKAGLKVGDELIKVNDTDVTAIGLSDTVALIKGEEGKRSVLTILRQEGNTVVEKKFTVVCENIIKQSVSGKMLDGNVGYIRITEFDKETTSQYQEKLNELESQKIKGLIIDVRDNGGGSLDACIAMLDRMLPAGNLITEKNKAKGDKQYTSTDQEYFDKPVVVLINGNSASASEVFAGTLQDRGAATLVGVTSYGKGIVQTIYSLQNSCGGGLKLTTGEYLLPSGRSIHETGLTPDVESEYTGKTKEPGADDDNQLIRAKEILLAKLNE